MKIYEFLSVAKDIQLFCVKNVGETINDDEEFLDRDDMEFREYTKCDIDEIDFILDLQRSCVYEINIVPVLFIKDESDKEMDCLVCTLNKENACTDCCRDWELEED
jgi:hypothetical protein